MLRVKERLTRYKKWLFVVQHRHAPPQTPLHHHFQIQVVIKLLRFLMR